MADLYEFIGGRGDRGDAVLADGMTDDRRDSTINYNLAYHHLEELPAVCEVDAAGVAYLAVTLRDLQKQRDAVEFIVPVARLIDTAGGQYTFRRIFLARLDKEENLARAREAIAKYEAGETGLAVRFAGGDEQLGVETMPKSKLPAGIADADFPGPDAAIPTDLMTGEERNEAVAGLIGAVMDAFESDIIILERRLAARFEDITYSKSWQRKWYDEFEQFGLTGKWLRDGEHPAAVMFMRLGGSNMASRVLTEADLVDNGIYKPAGEMMPGEFAAGGVRIRRRKGRDRNAIGELFRTMVNFYREKHGREVLLVMTGRAVFEAIVQAGVDFGDEEHWEPFVKQLRGCGVLAFVDDPDAMFRRDFEFMAAGTGFWRLSCDAEGDQTVLKVKADGELLEADGFMAAGRFTYVNHAEFRIVLD